MRDDKMLVLLIIAALFGIGFALGYGVRDLKSRRGRHRHWHSDESRRPKPRLDRPATDPAARPLIMDVDRLLIAANDELARHRQPPQGGQIVEQKDQQDDFDVAVRDLLVELNRRSSQRPAPARRVQR
jgi:hypothetical protein